MAATSSAPRIRRTAHNTQFTYQLPHRVNDVQTYPVQSPQGATILIYGHDSGITLLWRGGRRLKPMTKKPAHKAKKQNGVSDDVVMVISSDEDEPPAKAQSAITFVDKPSFEDEPDDGPYPDIVQTLDLTLGTAVLNVAVMPLMPCSANEAPLDGAGILTERLVFAVSCVTNDVYVITLPLTPPSHESKARPELRTDLLAGKAGSGAWGETLTLLGGQTRYSDGIAISLVGTKLLDKPNKEARAVVAAHSREASGVLRLWDVPLEPRNRPERPLEAFQTEYLPSALSSISFNPTHRSQLLAVSSPHGVRIYNYALPSIPSDPDAIGPFPSQGSWLLTLYQPFARPSPTRKPILDAQWIANGRAVFALLADGMWGIWDIDGASPATGGANLSNKLKSGVRGAALTIFSVSGYVEGTSSLRSGVPQARESSSGDFAPMTPHTRRQASASLGSANTLDRLATIKGGVSVMGLPATDSTTRDETLVLWVGGLEHVCVIPGVARFWESQLRKGSGGGVNLFSGAQPTRMVKLMDLSTGLLGERCCGTTLVPDDTGNGLHGGKEGGLPVDVLIRGESRLVVVREGEDGPGKKVGTAIVTRQRRLFSKGERSDAIIVHGKQQRAPSKSFNLSTAKAGSLRMKSLPQAFGEDGDGDMDATAGEDTLMLPSRPRTGFDFADTMNAAADVTADLSRDVEHEMLDIMDIDKALENMEDSRGSGRKKVFFEGA